MIIRLILLLILFYPAQTQNDDKKPPKLDLRNFDGTINGLSIGIDHYGLSAPYKDLAEEFGFIPVKIQKRILDHLNQLLWLYI